jgi:hypothetical protein
MSIEIGLPSLTIEPDTCVEVAPAAAAFAAATISVPDFDASPLSAAVEDCVDEEDELDEDEEEDPQPAIRSGSRIVPSSVRRLRMPLEVSMA